MTTRASVALALALFLLPVAAAAQPADRARAEALAAQAEKDVAARRYDAAIEAYRLAWEASREPVYLYDAAMVALVGRKDPLKAREWGLLYRAHARTPAERTEADAVVAKAEKALGRTHGRVEVRAAPAEAAIFLDRRDEATRLPAGTSWVPAGPHVVLAELAGHEPAQQRLVVKAGRTAVVDLALKTQAATLRIESEPPSARVSIDGGPVAVAPVEVRLKPGRHAYRVEADGYAPVVREVQVGLGDRIVVPIHLVADAALPVVPPKPVPAPGTVPAARADVPAPPPPAPARSSTGPAMRKAGFALIGIGFAAAAAGGICYGLAYKDYKDADAIDPDSPSFLAAADPDAAYQAAFDRKTTAGRKKGYAAYGLWGAGGALVVTGIVLAIAGDRAASVPAVAPIGPGGPGLTAIARF